MLSQIYPAESQLNRANTSDTEAPFLDLHLSILDGSTKGVLLLRFLNGTCYVCMYMVFSNMVN